MEKTDGAVEAEKDVTTDTNPQTRQEPGKTAGGDSKDGGSILAEADRDEGEGAAGTEGTKPAGVWREDWREAAAGGDAKRLAELQRHNSMESFIKSTWALRQKLSSGEYKRSNLPDDASDEDKAKWREENGIPKGPTEYAIPELDGYEWTEQDEPLLESLLTDLHGANVPQAQVDTMLGWYGKLVVQQRESQHAADVQDRERATDELRTNWNNEFRPNIKLIDRYLTDKEIFPETFRQMINDARLPDGKRFINQPGIADWLLNQAKDHYGAGAMLYGDAKASTNSRVDEIKKIRSTDYPRYVKEGLDQELLDLTRKMEAANGKKK